MSLDYTAILAQLEAIMPSCTIAEGVNDSEALGSAVNTTRFATIVDSVDRDVWGRIERRYPSRISPEPALIVSARIQGIAYTIYRRRGFGDDANPHSTEYKRLQKVLDDIANGDALLQEEPGKSAPATRVITTPSLLHSEHQGIIA